MFFSDFSPRSSNTNLVLPLTCSNTLLDRQTPPGSNSFSMRAATLTPSPKMSSPSIMMSPILMPIRKRISREAPSFLSDILACDGAGHRIDGAGELDQHSIASGLDDPALIRGDGWIDEFEPQRSQ